MKLTAIFLGALMSLSTTAYAGPFTDEMSKCLVKSVSESDKNLLIKWIYAAMSAHPDVKVLSNVSKEKGDELNKSASKLFIELITDRCKSQTEEAIKFEGNKAFEMSFGVLGQVAMQGILTNPNVTEYIAGLRQHIDAKALQDAFGAKQ